jgi:hypothetical protein
MRSTPGMKMACSGVIVGVELLRRLAAELAGGRFL